MQWVRLVGCMERVWLKGLGLQAKSGSALVTLFPFHRGVLCGRGYGVIRVLPVTHSSGRWR